MLKDPRVTQEGHIILPSKQYPARMFGLLKKKKIVTWSVFELQKSFSTQNSSTDNFQNILLNKCLPRRPLTSIFGDCNMKNSCWQLMTAIDSCSDISIMIYILRWLSVPNFISIRWSGAESFSSKVRIEEFSHTDIGTEIRTDSRRYRAPPRSEPKTSFIDEQDQRSTAPN